MDETAVLILLIEKLRVLVYSAEPVFHRHMVSRLGKDGLPAH